MSELPAWMSDKSKKQKQNRRSAQHEKDLAREVGGKTQPGSGSSPRARGDVKSADTLHEHKYTDGKSYRLDAEVLLRLLRDGLDQGRGCELVIDFERYGVRATVNIERRTTRGR